MAKDSGKQVKKAAPTSGKQNAAGKQKKKKWSKGKTKEKLNNAVIFDRETYDRLFEEIPLKNKLISPSVISDKLKVTASLARQAIKELEAKGIIRKVGDHHHAQYIYTRYTHNEK